MVPFQGKSRQLTPFKAGQDQQAVAVTGVCGRCGPKDRASQRGEKLTAARRASHRAGFQQARELGKAGFRAVAPLDFTGKRQVLPGGLAEQKILIGGHGVLEQPVDDDDVHPRQLHKIQDAMEQRLAAVRHDLEPEIFDGGAGVAEAGRGSAQLLHFFAEQAEEGHQFLADDGLFFRPGW